MAAGTGVGTSTPHRHLQYDVKIAKKAPQNQIIPATLSDFSNLFIPRLTVGNPVRNWRGGTPTGTSTEIFTSNGGLLATIATAFVRLAI
jgi:hypothetical protein